MSNNCTSCEVEIICDLLGFGQRELLCQVYKSPMTCK